MLPGRLLSSYIVRPAAHLAGQSEGMETLSFESWAFSFELYAMLFAPCPLRSFVKRANFFMDDTTIAKSRIKIWPHSPKNLFNMQSFLWITPFNINSAFRIPNSAIYYYTISLSPHINVCDALCSMRHALCDLLLGGPTFLGRTPENKFRDIWRCDPLDPFPRMKNWSHRPASAKKTCWQIRAIEWYIWPEEFRIVFHERVHY